MGNGSPVLFSSLQADGSTPFSYLATYLSSLCGRNSGLQCSTEPPFQTPLLAPAGGAVLWGGETLLQPCLRARAILIRAASVRPSIVLALTLAPVYHWFLSGGPPLRGGGGVVLGEGEEGGAIKGSLSARLHGPKKGMFIL